MLTDQIKNELAELNEEMLFADGFEGAYVGYATQFNKALAVYDYNLCVKILMDRDGMTDDEAIEYMDFNVLGAWVGENTPLFLYVEE